MSDRGSRRSVGAPFYAPPPRRKTSAEIISEARAAIFGEMSGSASSGATSLRPLRTRRPFTPREPQRTLFTERARKKDPRPPSAFDLKYLSLEESEEAVLVTSEPKHEDHIINETQSNVKKKPTLRNQSKSVQEKAGEGWSGFTRLPHLSGKSKPLHRRYTTSEAPSASQDQYLASTITIVRALEYAGDSLSDPSNKLASQDPCLKRRQFGLVKSVSYDVSAGSRLGDIPVKHLAVQLPHTTYNSYENMTVLEVAEALTERTLDNDRVVLLIEVLQNNLEENIPASSLKDLVLRGLYTHVDSDDERILVGIARAMLTMRVTGAHLAAACKLVFKIARNDSNDHFFTNTNLLELLVEGCGRADPVSEGDCCVYGAGALRFVALEPTLATRALDVGALHLAALHLKLLNSAKAENPRSITEHSIHAMYQLTGALRNLAGSSRAARAFVSSGALSELVTSLLHHTDRDVLTNVSRCLSVLSCEESCCEWLCASPTSARALLRALAACAARPPLAVRLAYTLGNMAAEDERARINIYNEDGGVDVLLTILESYTKRNPHDIRDPDSDPDLHLIGTDLGGSDGSNEDVLIKTVRVMANLCLAERAGRGLAALYAERTVRALLACLEIAERAVDLQIQELKEEEAGNIAERREELATAALATLNNLTFYREPPDPPDVLDDVLDQLCRATCRWLKGTSVTAACEAVRALGNLSRAARAAKLIVIEGAIECLPSFLQHEDESVRCAAAGVLVNVCGAGCDCREAAALAACALLQAHKHQDCCAAALLARALWNAHAHGPLQPEQARRAASALADFIDDDSVFQACEVTRNGERRASDTELSKHHVKFNLNNSFEESEKPSIKLKLQQKAYSVDHELHLQDLKHEEEREFSGEDLGFEDGDFGEDCHCGPCRRLAAWEELVGVAIPLLEKLRPPRSDASVGTD